MKRTALLFRATVATWVVAWFLPVVKDGTTLKKGGLPGWEAFRVALSPIWDAQHRDTIWDVTASPASALTNFWMLAVIAALVGKLRVPPKLALWGSAAATLLNAHWLLRANPGTDLYVGYYLWVLSFAILTWTVREASR